VWHVCLFILHSQPVSVFPSTSVYSIRQRSAALNADSRLSATQLCRRLPTSATHVAPHQPAGNVEKAALHT
jgi:hypothetical protein